MKPISERPSETEEHSFSTNNTKSNLKFLFVDDEEEDMYLFERGLEELNITHTMVHARSGDEMFAMLDGVKPDYIILDIFLPGKSGIACLKMLRNKAQYDTVPIIIYSKFIQPSFIEDCYQAKASYYIVKTETVSKLSNAFSVIFSNDSKASPFPERDQFLIQPRD